MYLFVGLPDAYESEGYDRATMALPPAHDALVRAVCAANPNTVVVLQGGSPMLLPWAGAPRAILLAYLGGCQGGGGVADVLLGKVCPGGKLAETWPMADGDSPCAGNWPGLGRQAVYTESLYVGYRWYDAAQKQVRWPFGHGLSYTSFSYSGLALSSPSFDAQGEGRLQVECTVVNTGPCAGSEAVQLYIAPQSPVLFKAPRTLQGFCKVRLAPGESARVRFTLDRSAFAHYSPTRRAWQVEPGAYRVELAASSRDIRLAAGLQVHSADAPEDLRAALPCYYAPGRGFHARQFERLYGGPLPAPRPARPYTLDSTVDELRGCFVGRVLHLGFRLYVWYTEKRDPGQARLARESAFDMPVRQFGMAGISMPRLLGLLDWANGHPWRGAFRLIFG